MNLLFVAHGSRRAAYRDDAEAFLLAWKSACPQYEVKLCYLELMEPSFKQALQDAPSDTYVMPLFLHQGWHFKYDITELISLAEIQVTMLPPLTFDVPLVEALYGRLMALPPQDGVLVIYSHGSKVSETQIHLTKLGAELQAKSGFKCVEVLAHGSPSLAEICKQYADAGEHRITILPHFLFSGVWQQKLEQEVQRLEYDLQLEIRVAEHLGHHPAMLHMIEMAIDSFK